MKLSPKAPWNLLGLLLCMGAVCCAQQPAALVRSPDARLEVQLIPGGEGQVFYRVNLEGKEVLKPSSLGLVLEEGDFTRGLRLLSVSPVRRVKDQYRMISAKRKDITYTANRKVVRLRNAGGAEMDLEFQVSNDGVAFRYSFPRRPGIRRVKAEHTGFHFDTESRAWLQPMQVAKTGWEKTNPAYEEHYERGIRVGTPSPLGAGWVYPALFETGGTWVLITEAGVDSGYCATRLQSESPDGEYRIGFPDPREVMSGGGLLPQSAGSLTTPWRILTIGSLKTIIESTLGTDLAKPSQVRNSSFARPGKASWSWINSKDDFIIYDEQKKYIDFAARMAWRYCLIDADWDRKIGYEKVGELARYAASKNVGLLLWYNSAGDWNTVKYTPKDLLLTGEGRAKEFSRLKAMGIKGVKIDFFAGDGRSVMKYYTDILKDAAAHGLMVNFHGATLPRGWQRTYPHLMTVEAVRGFEMVTFTQQDADRQPVHCTILPFTRNAFDPMDFTPVNLYKIPTRVVRKTSSAFELALSVLFQSGIQHFAESPEGMDHVPPFVQQFLRQLPDAWEDIRFIDGYPGKYVVLARKAAGKWYIAGINGEAQPKKIALPLALFGKKSATLITDGAEPLSFEQQAVGLKEVKELNIEMKGEGGFVLVLE